mmetsp:Transcript_28087/g.61607  ORF Transcript_28087/g.61607 Transcript_28087/m.61607 type:complete len:114 (-) Transcript_28087:1080-1421(-)
MTTWTQVPPEAQTALVQARAIAQLLHISLLASCKVTLLPHAATSRIQYCPFCKTCSTGSELSATHLLHQSISSVQLHFCSTSARLEAQLIMQVLPGATDLAVLCCNWSLPLQR